MSDNNLENQNVKENKSFISKIGLAVTNMWLAVIMPTKALQKTKDESKSFGDIMFFLGTIACVAAIVKVITKIISCMYYMFKFKTNQFTRVGWFGLVINQLIFVVLGAILIAGIYYITARIINKKLSYKSSLLVVTNSLVPIIAFSYVVAPIFTLVYIPLGLLIGYLGYIYMYLVLTFKISEELKLEENDIKIFYHIASTALLIILLYLFIKCKIQIM